MALLGEWNWWSPRPLDWLYARLRLDEAGGHLPAAGR